MDASAIILAAGAGTRMKSKKPKVAHEILGKPLINWVIDAATQAGVTRSVCVLGHEREQVIPLVEDVADIVFQEERLGTGDAVNAARAYFESCSGLVLVLSGDCPFVRSETYTALLNATAQAQASMGLLTMELENPYGYGRIVRNEQHDITCIVEEKDASDTERLIRECNAGVYCFDIEDLFWALERVSCENAQGEYYLTDVLALLKQAGKGVVGIKVEDPSECLGINSRAQLALATKVIQRRINEHHMQAGVTMWDPDQIWIGPDVTLDPDVELLPQTYLLGKTHVASNCVIGPNSRIINSQISAACKIEESIILESTLERGVQVGPRAYLRPQTYMCEYSKAGTHVEIKKSVIGPNSKVPHLSYIGDAELGEDVNIGAGTITCNYDGAKKHKTLIGDGVFVGSDTMLVAPVSIGDNALIGAGSTITKDVSAFSLGLARADQVEKKDWVKARLSKDSNGA